ncbi:hypothetical protein ES692_17230 [Psychroserpens burtonensis]|uniref:Uncharacterized protein n=1 Tax=Psychroserpens burtonensis TaxID=49278 RepID=A0A5C7BBL1_9FLAO|nr:hypothetical protein [Psychroserpens burtonensis]TXE15321.1 hypothetical protein ES692_17230 [Psychroserpens burtonensis]
MSVNGEHQALTKQGVILGTIGIDKDFIAERDYNTIALPNYENPIKVSASLVAFNKRTFKLFSEAQNTQSERVNISYNDTLDDKAQYLKIEIIDRLEILNSLKTKTNDDAFQFLKDNSRTHVITSVAIALDTLNIVAITNAQEIFLEITGVKTYSLNLYKDNSLQKKIFFNEGVVFAYQSSSPCWKQNDKYQLEIIDLVETNDKCPNNSFRSSNRAKKKINYFKL